MGFGLGGVIVLLVLVTLALYGLSARILNKTYAVPAEAAIVVPSGPAAIAEGGRLVLSRGCTGCHGPNLEGEMMVDDPMLARIASPNLSRLPPTYSDAELKRLLRHVALGGYLADELRGVSRSRSQRAAGWRTPGAQFGGRGRLLRFGVPLLLPDR